MDANTLLKLAIKEVKNLNRDEVFIVRDLFKGYEWNREEKRDRLTLGTLFLNYANNEPLLEVIEKKSSSNKQKYKKL